MSTISLRSVVIFINGQYNDKDFYQRELTGSEFVIAVDGGANFTDKVGITPDLLLGDMDSIYDEVYTKYQEQGVTIEEFPDEKDESDLELALNKAITYRPDEIIILGGFGARVDHLFANIMVLIKPIKHGITTWLKDEIHKVTVIEKQISLQAQYGDYLSLFPLTPEVTNITAQGLKYPLQGETLYMGPSRGLSNEFIKQNVTVSIATGYLLAIVTNRYLSD